PLQIPKPPAKSSGSIVARRSPLRSPASSVEGPREPCITVGIVLTRPAPGRRQVTHGPSLLNSAVVPLGFVAPTLSSGGAWTESVDGGSTLGGLVEWSRCGAKAAGYVGRRSPELPAETTTATPRRRSARRTPANGASNRASSGRSCRYPQDSTSTSTG